MESIDQLDTFIDPDVHLVFKSLHNKMHDKNNYIGGGAGSLLSRAMGKFFATMSQNLIKIANYSFRSQDDTAIWYVLWYIFPKIIIGTTRGSYNLIVNYHFSHKLAL